MSEELTFESLKIRKEILDALTREGIKVPTTIQAKAIPLMYQGKDVIGISRTGSGKTAAFGIPVLDMVEEGKGVQALVLAPTRELANQISNEMRKWGKNLKLNIATVFGGVGLDPQIRQIERSEIVVGTPGRIIDHLSRGNLDLDKLKFFVLDEADKMVEMGFIEDIERVLSAAPDDRQIILFGATISNEVDYLKNKYMHNAVVAEAELHVKKDLLEQYYYNVKTNEKFSLLVHLLRKEKMGRAMIFCSKRSTVELVYNNLRNQGIKGEMIHGKMTQNKRLNTIERFNEGKCDILIASAVAARGLDIKDVTHIYNYDLSRDPQEYVHRVGRTARAGESGKAITLLSDQDHEAFYAVLRRYSIEVEELEAESFEKIRFETRGRDDNRGGHRGFDRRNQRGSSHSGDSRGRSGGQRSGGDRRSSGGSSRSSFGASSPGGSNRTSSKGRTSKSFGRRN